MRTTAISVAGAVTVLLGLSLVWAWVTPESIGRVPTGQLAGVLALLVLPALALGAAVLDRHVARERLRTPTDADDARDDLDLLARADALETQDAGAIAGSSADGAVSGEAVGVPGAPARLSARAGEVPGRVEHRPGRLASDHRRRSEPVRSGR